jgi:hypothetical protein
MRHIVTLSLVFFSLTHLAKAERVEGLRLITEKYCNKQHSGTELVNVRSSQPDDQHHPYFLSSSELTSIGVLPVMRIAKYRSCNQSVTNLTIREKPKNNSP